MEKSQIIIFKLLGADGHFQIMLTIYNKKKRLRGNQSNGIQYSAGEAIPDHVITVVWDSVNIFRVSRTQKQL